MVVGDAGDGTLTVESGGAVTSLNADIGTQAGSQGILTIQNGGMVNVGSATVFGASFIGVESGSTGMATVDGAGSTWTSTGNLFVGNSGTGTLTISNGGQVSSASGTVGRQIGSQGTVTVTGAGSIWSNSIFIEVGSSGAGELIIANGGTVTSVTGGELGVDPDGQGVVTVTGAGSTWTSQAGPVIVGNQGAGELTIEDGASVSSVQGIVGRFTGARGTATVTGPNATWTNSADFSVGSQGGTGTLTVADGGAVNNTDGIVGGSTGSQGTATVTGAGSSWSNSGLLAVGSNGGTGTLSVEDGGVVSSTFGGIATFSANSAGVVTVAGTGSTWTNSSTLIVGRDGNGSLAIKGGGAVDDTDGVLGFNPGSDGAVAVTGAGSSWDNSFSVAIGRLGVGTLTIENGGRVTDQSASIGNLSGSQGTATVSGTGSSWANSGPLAIGNLGTGTLTIQDGGAVSDANGFVGGTSEGTVTVTGAGSTWTNSGELEIGVFSDGAGTLTIAGGGSVSDTLGTIGVNPGSAGAAMVTGPGSTWTSTGGLFVGFNGTGVLTVADRGTVRAPAISVGAGGGDFGILNIGAAAGQPAAAPGILDTGLVVVGAVGTLNFNHTANDYLFAPEITGAGDVNVLSGTTILAATNTYTGATTIDGGALIVNGSIAESSLLTVNAGGVVGGVGKLPSAVVNGGAIAPGNSIGTLSVNGSVAINAGSTYQVEVNAAGASDRIEATGTAMLNGGVVEVVPSPDFALATPYAILTADGGLSGTFDDVALNLSSLFLSPDLTYDANDVFLTITQSASFGSVALTPNEIATANGADSLGPGKEVWNTIAELGSAEDARAAFDALSGEIHASIGGAMLEDSGFVRDAATGRVRAAFEGIATPSLPVMALGERGPAPASADTERFAAWGQGFGSWGTWDSDGNAASLDRSVGGFLVGADGMIAENWRLGLLAGYSRSSFDVDDRASSGDSDNYHLGLYGGTQWGALGFRAGAAYTWHNIDTSRQAAFPGFAETLTADYDAGTAQAFGELGYRIDRDGFAFEPFADLAYVNVHTDGFTEDGGAAALTGASSNTDATFTTLGLRAATDFSLGGMKAKASGTIGWRHAFGDVIPIASFAFAGSDAFTIAGTPIAEDALVLEAGFDIGISKQSSIGLSYSGQIATSAGDHGFRADFTMKF